MNQSDLEIFKQMQRSPIFFIEKMWGITPERDSSKFIKGKNLSHQQHDLLLAVEKAIRDEAPRRISVASGHGTGKTMTISCLLLWYLFCFKDAQIACTAPTSDQMFDVLWKEVSKWRSIMPKVIADKYEWQSSHVRIKESPETWFARAKTARKEEPEALAGVHGDYVMLLADEAAGVPEEIYNTAEGSLTDKNTLTILISNPTRIFGYFYDSHHKDKKNWQTLQFSSIESPLVDIEYNHRIREKHGEDSDEYRIRVLGQFPKIDAVDDKGYVPLLSESDIKYCEDYDIDRLLVGDRRLGVDCAGEGSDLSTWVVRDNFKSKIMASEKISNAKTIAQKTLTLMDYTKTQDYNVTIDGFGEGMNVSREIALAKDFGNPRVNSVNVGDKADDPEIYLNKRAEMYFRGKEWIRRGGEFVRDSRWRELLTIRYRRELNGKIKIMSKQDMKKAGLSSPDFCDAWAMTFVKGESETKKVKQFIPKY